MSKVIGIRVLEDNKERIEWHAHGVTSDYHTLCGMDGDDPSIGHLGLISPESSQKITCQDCKTIWKNVMELGLRPSNFK